MSTENFGERIKRAFKVIIGDAGTVSESTIEDLKRRANQSESQKSYEQKMAWMEKPFLVLQVRGEEKKQVLSRHVNPKLHSAFNPAIKVNIKSERLVGRVLPLTFLINSDRMEKVMSIPASHVLKKGPNIVMPKIAIKTEAFPEGIYTVSVAIPAGFILNTTSFPVSSDATRDLNDILEEGLTLQDLINLVEENQ